MCLAALVLLATTSGCAASSGTPSVQQNATSRSARWPTRLHEVSRQVYPLANGIADFVTAGDTGAVTEVRNSRGYSMYWTDYGSGRTRLITDSTWFNVGLEVTDRWVVWVEQDMGQSSEALKPVAWRIRAEEIDTGNDLDLLESHTRTELPPDFTVWKDQLFYTLYNGLNRGTVDIREHDIVAGDDQLFKADLPAGLVAYDGNRLLTIVTTSRGHTPGQSRSDLFDVDPRSVKRLTTGGGVDVADVSGDILVWRNCRRGICTASASQWPGMSDERVLQTPDDAVPEVGNGFFTFDTYIGGPSAEVIAAPLGNPGDQTRLLQPEGEQMRRYPSVFGNHVVWTTDAGPRRDKAGSLVVVTIGTE